MENANAPPGSNPAEHLSYNHKLKADRLLEIIERRKKESEEAIQRRRADRPLGKLTPDLVHRLRSCNVAQLKRVKKLCDHYIKDHRKPPAADECRKAFIIEVLESVTVKNCRYELEFPRTTLRAKQIYISRPRVWVYWRDGRIIQTRNISKGKYRSLPRKVWSAFKGYLDIPKRKHFARSSPNRLGYPSLTDHGIRDQTGMTLKKIPHPRRTQLPRPYRESRLAESST
jgi:hypothetical protein